ncbi:MAG: hypothetical protein RLZZ500_1181 [Bacteroidota bacterium]
MQLRYKNVVDMEQKVKQLNSLTKNKTDAVLTEIAWTYYSQRVGNERTLFEHASKAKSLLKSVPNDSLSYYIQAAFGNYYKNNGDYVQALRFLYQAKQQAIQLKSTDKEASCWANIGQVFYQKNELDKAIAFSKKATAFTPISNNAAAYLIALHTLANIEGMSGRFDAALTYDAKGIALCKQFGLQQLTVTFLDNQANCYLYSGQLAKAHQSFHQCLALDLQNKQQKQIADTYTNLAQLAAFQGQRDSLLYYTNRSFAIAEKVHYKPGYLKNYSALRDYYKMEKNFPKAFEFQEKYQQVYQELMNEKRENAQIAYRILHDTEAKENALLAKEVEVQSGRIVIIIITVLFLVAISLGYFLFQKNKRQQKQFLWEQHVKEIETTNRLNAQKIEISRELHDNIGSQLTFINAIIQGLQKTALFQEEKTKQKLQTIADFTQTTISELRDTIWILNPKNQTLDELKIRMVNFINKAREASETIQFEFDFYPDASMKLTTRQTMVHFRVFQEAVNNAIKHAQATTIELKWFSEAQQSVLTIQDNGIGLDWEIAKTQSQGLQTMQQRVTEVGGTFVLDSEPNKGTLLTIKLPIA